MADRTRVLVVPEDPLQLLLFLLLVLIGLPVILQAQVKPPVVKARVRVPRRRRKKR